MQVDGIVESSQSGKGVRIRPVQAKRRAELDLGDADAGGVQAVRRLHRVLELDSRVAGIQADAEVAVQGVLRLGARQTGQFRQPAHGARGMQEPPEEIQRLSRRFQQAARLGFQPQDNGAASPLPQAVEMGRVAQQGIGDGCRTPGPGIWPGF